MIFVFSLLFIGIPLRVLNPQIGCRPQEHVDLGRFPGHIPNGSAGQAPQNPVQGTYFFHL